MAVVTIDTRGRALEHVVHVSRGGHDNVMWVAAGNGGPWKITFDKPPAPAGGVPFEAGSPFDQNEYIVARGWFVSTQNGPRVNAVENGTYKYNVRDLNNPAVPTDDPDVDVDP